MNLKDMIEEMYESETLGALMEAETKAVNIAVPVGTFAMLRVISKRFDKSLSSLGAEVLKDAVNEMWYYLSDKDKQELSAEADDLAHETLLQQGVSLTPAYDNWTSQYRIFVKHSEQQLGAKGE